MFWYEEAKCGGTVFIRPSTNNTINCKHKKFSKKADPFLTFKELQKNCFFFVKIKFAVDAKFPCNLYKICHL